MNLKHMFLLSVEKMLFENNTYQYDAYCFEIRTLLSLTDNFFIYIFITTKTTINIINYPINLDY